MYNKVGPRITKGLLTHVSLQSMLCCDFVYSCQYLDVVCSSAGCECAQYCTAHSVVIVEGVVYNAQCTVHITVRLRFAFSLIAVSH